jgi:hypothetical protein
VLSPSLGCKRFSITCRVVRGYPGGWLRHIDSYSVPQHHGEGPAISILHFPLRSYEQFEQKIVSKGSAHERHPELAGTGGATRHLYEIYKAGGLRAGSAS